MWEAFEHSDVDSLHEASAVDGLDAQLCVLVTHTQVGRHAYLLSGQQETIWCRLAMRDVICNTMSQPAGKSVGLMEGVVCFAYQGRPTVAQMSNSYCSSGGHH